MPGAELAPSYGSKRTSPTGLIVTILLHLLLVAIYLFQPARKEKSTPPSAHETTVYLSPLEGKPKAARQEHAPKKVVKSKPTKSEPVRIQRLPNTITLPQEKPVEVAKAEPKKEAPPEPDLQAYIEARRKQRGARTDSDAPQESDEARGMRNALANVAAANGRSRDDSNESGGVFSITNKTFHSADVKFRGWNPSFKRRWLTQVTVEIGNAPDIETAIVMKMIELIRKEKTGDFEWDSHRLNRVVTMSARPEDTEQLKAFLFKEMFEDYKPPRH